MSELLGMAFVIAMGLVICGIQIRKGLESVQIKSTNIFTLPEGTTVEEKKPD